MQELAIFEEKTMQARIYHPGLGKFVQPDTIVPDVGNPQALNRYSYVFNNPLKYIDPSGHIACELVGECGENGDSSTGSNIDSPSLGLDDLEGEMIKHKQKSWGNRRHVYLPLNGGCLNTRTGCVTQRYGENGHMAVDYDGYLDAENYENSDPVYATTDGFITLIPDDGVNPFGNHILLVTFIRDQRFVQIFAHLSGFNDNLQNGQVVLAGDLIGYVGNSGNSRSSNGGDGSHLHWEARTSEGFEFDFQRHTARLNLPGNSQVVPYILLNVYQNNGSRTPFTYYFMPGQ